MFKEIIESRKINTFTLCFQKTKTMLKVGYRTPEVRKGGGVLLREAFFEYTIVGT